MARNLASPKERLATGWRSTVATRPDVFTAGTNVICVTGPSRTADIELTLRRGVHGPRIVHAIVVD